MTKQEAIKKLSKEITWNRKAVKFDEVGRGISLEKYFHELVLLNTYNCKELYALDFDPVFILHDEFIINPTGGMFIYQDQKEQLWLVDCAGYDYMRYIVRIWDV